MPRFVACNAYTVSDQHDKRFTYWCDAVIPKADLYRWHAEDSMRIQMLYLSKEFTSQIFHGMIRAQLEKRTEIYRTISRQLRKNIDYNSPSNETKLDNKTTFALQEEENVLFDFLNRPP